MSSRRASTSADRTIDGCSIDACGWHWRSHVRVLIFAARPRDCASEQRQSVVAEDVMRYTRFVRFACYRSFIVAAQFIGRSEDAPPQAEPLLYCQQKHPHAA